MIETAWHQFRTQAAIAACGLVVTAITLLITGPHLVDLYNTTVATCKAQHDCQTAKSAFVNTDKFVQNGLTALVVSVPALIGVFWGAPLIARELETGTYRLAWTQSVTRTRWLATKLGLVSVASIAFTGSLSIMTTWWFQPIDRANANQFSWMVFDARNLAPIGYALFACALGVTAGALLRRTVPAMAATLAGFIVARLAITHWVRPNLISPAHTSAAIGAAQNIFQGTASGTTFSSSNAVIPNAWTISSRIVNATGHSPTSHTLQQFLRQACPNISAPPDTGGSQGPDPATFQDCIAQLSAKFHLAVSYQPASHYWDIQSLELTVYIGLAIILGIVSVWAVRHRLS